MSVIVLNLVLGAIIPVIDNYAHIGGLVAGFLVGYAAGTPRLVESWRERFWRWAAYACVAVTVLAFVRMFLGVESLLG